MHKVHSYVTALVVTFLACIAAANPAESGTRLSISRENAQLLEDIGSHPDLEVLSISCLEKLQSLPDSIGELTRLKELVMDNGNGCAMNPVLPEAIGNLRSLEKLVLYGAQDPGKAGRQHQQYHPFPHSMSQLKNVTYLDLGRNGFQDIPGFVNDLSKLRELGFAWNRLKEVPPFISDLRELRELRLEGNDLDDLPDSLNALPSLARVTLGNNCKITQNGGKMRSLRNRFPKVRFDFADEYDCP